MSNDAVLTMDTACFKNWVSEVLAMDINNLKSLIDFYN